MKRWSHLETEMFSIHSTSICKTKNILPSFRGPKIIKGEIHPKK